MTPSSPDHKVRGVVRISLGLEIIRAHHGDVNETAGDGLMVIFQSEGSASRHPHQLKNVAAPVRVFRLVPAGIYSKVTP